MKRVEMSIPLAEALLMLALLDHEHNCNQNQLAKQAAKKLWQHLVDAGVLERERKK